MKKAIITGMLLLSSVALLAACSNSKTTSSSSSSSSSVTSSSSVASSSAKPSAVPAPALSSFTKSIYDNIQLAVPGNQSRDEVDWVNYAGDLNGGTDFNSLKKQIGSTDVAAGQEYVYPSKMLAVETYHGIRWADGSVVTVTLEVNLPSNKIINKTYMIDGHV